MASGRVSVAIPKDYQRVPPKSSFAVQEETPESSTDSSKNTPLSFVLRCPKGFDTSLLNGADIPLSTFEYARSQPGGTLRLELNDEYDLEINGAPEISGMMILAPDVAKDGYTSRKIHYAAAVVKRLPASAETKADEEKKEKAASGGHTTEAIRKKAEELLQRHGCGTGHKKRKRTISVDAFSAFQANQMSELKFRDSFLPFSIENTTTASTTQQD